MATKVEDSPERLSLRDEDGRLITAEHCGRYLWAAQLASGRNVLDAGCGTGYGTKILADAGCAHVVGIDISEPAILEATKTYSSEGIELRSGDLRTLPFSDGRFDLIVCFEVIEHIEDPEKVLDELTRVLAPSGLLCISTPNSRIYPPGNPHHVHEYEPEEFARALGERLPYVDLYRQGAWLGSGILSGDEFSMKGSTEGFSSHIVKLDDKSPGEEIFTVALASSSQLPSTESVFVLSEPFEVRWWQEQLDAGGEQADAAVNEARRQLHQANQAALEANAKSVQSAKQLLRVEEHVSTLNGRIHTLEEELGNRSDQIDALSDKAERAERIIAGMKTSISWRITRPLRALKRFR